MTKIGDRIGALLSEQDGKAYFLGYGVRLPDEVPESDCQGLGPLLRENNITNPTLLLDNGKKVYGCECWWGSEIAVKKHLEHTEIIEVDIDEARKHWESE